MWAVCNKSKPAPTPAPAPAPAKAPAKAPASTLLPALSLAKLVPKTCVTDHAALLYFLLVVSSFLGLIYHWCLALIWPCNKEFLLAERGCSAVCCEKAQQVSDRIPVSISGLQKQNADDEPVVKIHDTGKGPVSNDEPVVVIHGAGKGQDSDVGVAGR